MTEAERVVGGTGSQQPPFYTAPTVHEATLASLAWGHTTAAVRAGAYTFRVRSTDADFGLHLERLLSGFPAADDDQVATTYSVVSRVAGHPSWWAAFAGTRRISDCAEASVVLTHLFANINRAVVDHGPEDVVYLHAAACAWRGYAVVLAGPTESGKSTLAAGLALRGLQYLTDEVAQIHPVDLTVAPYAKPPSIDPGAWPVLEALRPRVPGALADVAKTQWHVDPALLPGGVAAEPVPVRLLVRCRWRASSPTLFRPTSRAGAVVDLALDMFRPRRQLAHQVDVLARLARQALVYDLVYDDLDEAASAITDLLESP